MPRPRQIFAVSGITSPPPDWTPPQRSALLEHAISLTGVARAKVCYLATAMGDSPEAIANVYAAFEGAEHATLSHLQLFPQPNVDDVRSHLLSQDLIWVGGGSVVNLLAVWRAHRLDEIMRECWEAGVVLGGGSAGSICWHIGGTTDSFSDRLDPVTDGLAFLPYSNGVHHDLPDQPRRSKLHELIGSGALPAGYATDDGTGLHYLDTMLHEAVRTFPGTDAYEVRLQGSTVIERPLSARSLT
jgi:peptidase E